MRTQFQRLSCAVVAAFLLTAAFLPARVRADAPATAPAAGKCMMWKVSSDTATVYLVGSMHLATPEMYPLPREMEDAFASADTLVVEVNTNKLDQAKLMPLMQTKGMYQGDDTLTANLKKETMQALQQECAKLSLPTAGIEKMKPWAVGLILELMEIQKLGLDPNLGIDKHFLDLASEKGKTIAELESADFQLNLLAGFDAKMQELSLIATLAEMKNLKGDMTELTDAWIAGDAQAAEAQLDRHIKEHPETAEVDQKLISDRNVPMARKVEAYLKGKGTVFVVAGCFHMIGDKGIVKILRDDKFTVEQSPATKIVKAEKP
jgi:uncharacterized protein YbaP (TraB family)